MRRRSDCYESRMPAKAKAFFLFRIRIVINVDRESINDKPGHLSFKRKSGALVRFRATL
jgi:hypothetical protein